MNKEKVICVDGGYILHRSIFAFMTNPQAPATFTYMSMIVSYLRKLEVTLDDQIIIAQDYGRSWRKSLDHNYKAQRKDAREQKFPPEWWKKQYDLFNAFFEQLEPAINWQFIKIWGTEADDIASMVSRYYKDNEVIHISSDRDWEMLAAFPNTKIFSPLMNKKTKVPVFKDIKAPLAILNEKIQGDVSDNLLTKPSSEAEFEIRKTIVNLLELPHEIEQPIKQELDKLLPKNIYLHKIRYPSIAERIKKLYEIGDK